MKVVVHPPTLSAAGDGRVAAAVLAAVRVELRRLDPGEDEDRLSPRAPADRNPARAAPR